MGPTRSPEGALDSLQNSLLDQLASPTLSESEAIEVLGKVSSVGERHRLALSQRVEAIINATTSRGVRNAAAIALADLGRIEAAPTLNSLLSRPDLARSAGTLVFAMEELGACVSIDAVLNIIERGSYEARAEMLILLGKGLLEPLEDRRLGMARQRLSDLADCHDEELAEAAALARDRLPSAGLAQAS